MFLHNNNNRYREIIEKNVSIDYLLKNYKQYIPKELVTKHGRFLNKILAEQLQIISNKKHEAYYIKNSYLEEINKLAPNYFTEEYNGSAQYLAEDGLNTQGSNSSCPVKIQFSLFHPEQPGLRVFYSYKNNWKHIAKIENIYAIMIENNEVKIEMENQPQGFKLTIANRQDLESFVSCIAGYYRLTVKWSVNLCQSLPIPSLDYLRSIKCHGPIG